MTKIINAQVHFSDRKTQVAVAAARKGAVARARKVVLGGLTPANDPDPVAA